MLSIDATGLAVNIAQGLIKITHLIDVMLAEKETVQSPLAIAVAEVSLPPTPPRIRTVLRKNVNGHPLWCGNHAWITALELN